MTGGERRAARRGGGSSAGFSLSLGSLVLRGSGASEKGILLVTNLFLIFTLKLFHWSLFGGVSLQ